MIVGIIQFSIIIILFTIGIINWDNNNYLGSISMLLAFAFMIGFNILNEHRESEKK